MTLYRAASGALVFSAGSPQFSWGLDDLHNYFTTPGRVRPDPMGTVKAMQQATVNLFADMGVQSGSRQPELRPAEPSADRTGPLAKIDAPASGTTVEGIVTVTGTATDAEGMVAGVEVSVDGGETWHRAEGTTHWSYEWRVSADVGRATIVSRATDDSANIGENSARVQVDGPRQRTAQ